jgi:hypothetical protein
MFNKLFGSKKPSCGLVRQGDVFIVPVAKLPGDLTGTRPVLAEGEVTGHAHRVADPTTAQVFKGSSGLFLEVTADSATVVHDEHAPVTVPRGSYEIRIQREYHPKEIRRVVD